MALVAGSLKRLGKRQHCGEIVKPSSNVRKRKITSADPHRGHLVSLRRTLHDSGQPAYDN